MQVNADFSQAVTIRPDQYAWVASPANGVERMMLDRIGGEIARATTLVRFAPNSQFDAHRHGGGEEFLVLEGVFSDEFGDYPAGTYIRNPPGTAHRPHIGEQGALILVKLHQFTKDDGKQLAIQTETASYHDLSDGITQMMLHEVPGETVRMVKLAAGAAASEMRYDGGAEIFVLSGGFEDENGQYPTGSWLRLPDGATQTTSSAEGCVLWVKTGHLGAAFVEAPEGAI